jgi:GalNAc-alpha-(1->4)-GalNAc-alpha-(1->3)-diNAcBac-PP-undecaprenol alpha-1,4-N-acetyl-D-galactosaminyltransferase
MRFLFVIDNISTGGAQRQMVNLALGLSKRKHEIEFFCYYPQDLLAAPLRDNGIPIWLHHKRGRLSPGIISALRRRLRDGRYDAVLSFMTTPNFYSIVSANLLHDRPRIVVSDRWCDPDSGIDRTVRLVRQFYRFADHVISNSHHQRESLLRSHQWLKNRAGTVYNGYDLATFHPPSVRTKARDLRILTVARVDPWKNGLALIRALQILKSRYGLSPIVNWVGERVMKKGGLEYLQAMEKEIDDFGLRAQWNWLGQRTDIVDLMHKHDILVHPSWAEGLPNAVCEALACGLPVIVSNTLDHPRLVQDGKTG